MIRRHVIRQDLRYSHQTTPRKQRTYAHTSVFHPTLFYKSSPRGVYTPNVYDNTWEGAPTRKWIGKVFVSMDSSPQEIQAALREARTRDYVHESEVAQAARPNYFRIFRVIHKDGKLMVRSKPHVYGRPQQMNLFIDEKDIIRDVQFF